MASQENNSERLASLTQHVRNFLYALDRGYFGWDGDSAFVDALRGAVAK